MKHNPASKFCTILALVSMVLMAITPGPTFSETDFTHNENAQTPKQEPEISTLHETTANASSRSKLNYTNWEAGAAYDYASTRSAGILPYGGYADFRTASGITVTCTGNTASVYYYTRNSARPGTLSLEPRYGKSIWQTTLTSADTPVALPALADGTYFVRHTDSNGDMCAVRLEVKDGTAQACRSAMDPARIARFRQLMSAIKPENAKSVSAIFYPAGYNHQDECIETAKWAKLSHELLPGPENSYTDSQKVYAFARWIAENIAYDTVKTTLGGGLTRAHRAMELGDKDAYSDPKYFTWETRCGVCADYADILVIMCREHGIPATTVVSDTAWHAWTGVYLDGHWEPVDITSFNTWEIQTDDNILDEDPGMRVPFHVNYTMNDFLRADMVRHEPEYAGIQLCDKASYEWAKAHGWLK